jgi:hypothetical protein
MRSLVVVTGLFALATAGATAQTVRGASAVRGRVLNATGAPLPGALVTRDGSADTARAGADGSFLMGQLALGRHSFTVSAPGFQAVAFEVDFTAVDTASGVDIPLEPGASTPGAGAPNAAAANWLDGFNRRKTAAPSSGTFFTGEQIIASNAVRLSQLLEGIRDVTVRTERGNIVVAYGRSARCTMNVWLDGRKLDNVFPPFDPSSGSASIGFSSRSQRRATLTYTGIDGVLPPASVAAIEVYTLPSQVPEQFQRSAEIGNMETRDNQGGDCGAILLWQR